MRRRRYTIACLAGNGTGPELVAQASRGMAAAGRPHGLTVDEVHPPFGTEAFVQTGHPLPPSTRRAYAGADAVLAAGADPALSGVEADLDVRAGLARVLLPGRADVAVVSSLGDGDQEWTVERALELACRRHGHVAVVGAERAFLALVARTADGSPGLRVETLTRPQALTLLGKEPERFDVVLGERAFAGVLAHTTGFGFPGRVSAFGRLASSGPGLFFPAEDGDGDGAGHAAADPAAVLLAAALALGEGLGETGAARTLEGALVAARTTARDGTTTHERTDAVLAAIPASVANAEFAAR